MRRTHAMMPLTQQEEAVRRLLIEERFSFEHHYVFDFTPSCRLSVDFLVFYGAGVVIECTACSTRRGRALSEVRRRSAYMDYKFGLLKVSFPKLTCGVLIEAPNENQEHLGRELKQILKDSDFIARSNEELRDELSKMLEAGV